MELNASDERGISVVRNKIKSFASGAIGKPDPDYPCPPYKILILDEADSMTQARFPDCKLLLLIIIETVGSVACEERLQRSFGHRKSLGSGAI
jgi:DNA polymerase III delta prime subunit